MKYLYFFIAIIFLGACTSNPNTTVVPVSSFSITFNGKTYNETSDAIHPISASVVIGRDLFFGNSIYISSVSVNTKNLLTGFEGQKSNMYSGAGSYNFGIRYPKDSILLNENFDTYTIGSLLSANGWTVVSGTSPIVVISAITPYPPLAIGAPTGTPQFMFDSSRGHQAGLLYRYYSMLNFSNAIMSIYVYRDQSVSYDTGLYLSEGVNIYIQKTNSSFTAPLAFIPRAVSGTCTGIASGVSSPIRAGWQQYTINVPIECNGLDTVYLGVECVSRGGNNIYYDNIAVHAPYNTLYAPFFLQDKADGNKVYTIDTFSTFNISYVDAHKIVGDFKMNLYLGGTLYPATGNFTYNFYYGSH